FARTSYRVPKEQNLPTVSNVNLVHLFNDRQLDVLVCDMRDGWLTALRPYTNPPSTVVLGKVGHAAHAEVVRFEKHGPKDVIVAALGKFYEGDDNALVGKVVLLKGDKQGKFTPHVLLEDVGRVADVQAGDFKGNGTIDLIVAVFGWRNTGAILYLE